MGAVRGSVSYLRFLVEGEPPRNLGSKYEQAIEARRFLPLTPEREEMEQAGWAPVEDPFDDELPVTRDHFLFGDLIAIAYREDKIALPRPLIQSMTKKRLEEMRERGEEIGRQTRRTVELAVTAELKARALPRPRTVDLVWDMRAKTLRIFGRGPMAAERAVGLFERTFDVRARLGHYGTRAFSLDLGLRAKGVLESLGPEPVFSE